MSWKRSMQQKKSTVDSNAKHTHTLYYTAHILFFMDAPLPSDYHVIHTVSEDQAKFSLCTDFSLSAFLLTE